jgi:hypothetical protein
MKVGDLVLRTWPARDLYGIGIVAVQRKAVITKVLGKLSVEVVWLDTFDRCISDKSPLEVLSESR